MASRLERKAMKSYSRPINDFESSVFNRKITILRKGVGEEQPSTSQSEMRAINAALPSLFGCTGTSEVDGTHTFETRGLVHIQENFDKNDSLIAVRHGIGKYWLPDLDIKIGEYIRPDWMSCSSIVSRNLQDVGRDNRRANKIADHSLMAGLRIWRQIDIVPVLIVMCPVENGIEMSKEWGGAHEAESCYPHSSVMASQRRSAERRAYGYVSYLRRAAHID
ncbi:hypothetical protein EDD18DRAFT_1111984 [Armillaria luteobubalina]|uniref:Uncharacterized protein n=1 Tax=Armillaria luteobubalina TaxID=153913 RepID=A0AA39UIK1_9AGAR|nr:hypothetical protein EDD18DRAFT_1111984 [Armillaria luteobubalina]